MNEDKRLTHHNFEDVVQDLRRVRDAGFFGTLNLGFQSGEMTQIEAKSVLKPGESLS